jgi:hypothetical protein
VRRGGGAPEATARALQEDDWVSGGCSAIVSSAADEFTASGGPA